MFNSMGGPCFAPMSFVRRVSELGRSWLIYHPNPCGILLGGLAYVEPIILFTTVKLLLTHIVWADQTGRYIKFIFPKLLKLCHPTADKWKGLWFSRLVVQWKCRSVMRSVLSQMDLTSNIYNNESEWEVKCKPQMWWKQDGCGDSNIVLGPD